MKTKISSLPQYYILIYLIIFPFTKINSQTEPNNIAFPLLNPTNDKNICVEDFVLDNPRTKKDKGFLKENPNYFQNGKYTVGSLNYLDYPSIEVNSSNQLNNYSSVTVFFSGYIPINTKNLDWYHCYFSSDFEIENDWIKIKKGFNEDFKDLNTYYKTEIYNILNNKKANNISVLDMLKDQMPVIDDLKNSLILQFNVTDFNLLVGKGQPNYAQFSLSVLNVKGDLVHQYNQILFFHSPIWHFQYLKVEKACIKQAFNCLINQFLNDSKTNLELKKLSDKQSKLVTFKTKEVNKLQIDLLNIKLEKTKIISNLKLLSVNMDGISSDTFVDTKSLTTYNPSYSPEINQMGSSLGTLAGGIANTIEANSQRNFINTNNAIGNKRKFRFRELEEEEKRIIADISSDILNSPAVLFLPNNTNLNQYMEAVTKSLEVKTTVAKSKVTVKKAKIQNDVDRQKAASAKKE